MADWIFGGKNTSSVITSSTGAIWSYVGGVWTRVYSASVGATQLHAFQSSDSGATVMAFGCYFTNANYLNYTRPLILKSLDGGLSWTALLSNVTATNIADGCLRADGEIWCTRNISIGQSLYRWNGGDSWTALSPDVGNWIERLLYVADDNIWIQGGAYYQWNGSTWTNRTGACPVSTSGSLCGDGQSGSTYIYYAYGGVALWRWDGGTTWTPVSPNTGSTWHSSFGRLWWDPETSYAWFAGNYKVGVIYYPSIWCWDGTSYTERYRGPGGSTNYNNACLFDIRRASDGEFMAVGTDANAPFAVQSDAAAETWTPVVLPSNFLARGVWPVAGGSGGNLAAGTQLAGLAGGRLSPTPF